MIRFIDCQNRNQYIFLQMSQFSQGLLSIDQLSDLEIMQVFQLARQFSERVSIN